MKNFSSQYNSIYLVLIIISFLFYSLFLTSLGFFFNIPITKYHAPSFLVLSLITPLIFFKNKNYWYLIIVSALCFFISYLIGGYFFDITWDGQWYHQEAIILLSDYWNPVKEASLARSSLWIDHYQKGIEIMQAVIYSFTNEIESSKMINILLLISTYFLVQKVIKLFFKSILLSVIFSLCIVLCPVTITQTLTFYIDSAYYLILLGLICTSILLIKENKRVYFLIFIFLSALICCIKVSTLPTFILLLIALFVYIFFRKKELLKNFFICIGLVFIISVVTNYNPFITNLIKGKHVFYPIMGTEKVDIMTHNTPEKLRNKNRFIQFIYATISESKHMEYKAKIPFSIHKEEINPALSCTPDLRLSGFGLLFSGILLLTIFNFVYFLFYNQKNKKFNYLIYFILFWNILSIIINPEFWWPRYAPQIWLIPILILLLIWNTKGILTFSKYLTLILIGINILFSLGLTTFNSIYQTKKIYSFLNRLQKSDTTVILDDPMYNIDVRFKEYNIKFIKGKLENNYEYVPETFNNVKFKISE